MHRFLPILFLLAWFSAVFAMSYAINWLLVRSVIYRAYRIFIAPGIVIHELSHALGCLMTGARITEINVWKADGGHVSYIPHRHFISRVVADPIISLAPIWGTFALLWLVTRLVLPDAMRMAQGVSVMDAVRHIDWKGWEIWVYIYVVTSLVATIAPSKSDMRYALTSLIVLGCLLVGSMWIPGVSNMLLSWIFQLKSFGLFTLGLLGVGLVIAVVLAMLNVEHYRAGRK